jgi:hypothetical protein
MRRKIEKFLAKKQGIDESSIRYTEDGRFDFLGDLEGVLAAVRGKDGLGKRKGDRKNSKKMHKKARKGDSKMPPMGMPMPYLPYGMPPPGHPMMAYPPPMHEMMMPHNATKENMMPPHMTPHYASKPMAEPMTASSNASSADNMHSKSGGDKGMFSYSPWNESSSGQDDESSTSAFDSTPGPRSGSRSTEFSSGCLSSSRKSIFDSPGQKTLGGNLGMTMGSPGGGLNINGMTPLSHLKDTFATPYSSEKFSHFSPGDNFNLNKALFADEEGRRHLKTSNVKTPRELKIMIGGSEDAFSRTISEMHYNRVSISPVACKGFGRSSFNESSTVKITLSASERKPSTRKKAPPVSATRSIHFADERDDQPISSGVNVHRFMPSIAVGEAHTPRNAERAADDARDITEPSPLDTSLTPLGSQDKSFWGRDLGFSPQQLSSYTPFKSPGVTATRKDSSRGALSTISVNTIGNSSVKKLKLPTKQGNNSIKNTKPTTSLQSPSPKLHGTVEVAVQE